MNITLHYTPDPVTGVSPTVTLPSETIAQVDVEVVPNSTRKEKKSSPRHSVVTTTEGKRFSVTESPEEIEALRNPEPVEEPADEEDEDEDDE